MMSGKITAEEARAYAARWTAFHSRRTDELRRMSYKEKFRQTVNLVAFVRVMGWNEPWRRMIGMTTSTGVRYASDIMDESECLRSATNY